MLFNLLKEKMRQRIRQKLMYRLKNKMNVRINTLKESNIMNNINTNKSSTLCMVAIFKNESHILKEWLEHYISEGVDKFFLIDNGSTDNYREIINPYILNNKVDLVIDATRFSQNKLYNKHFLKKCKMYDWVVVADLDEFIYARKDCNKITDYLNRLNNIISQVFIPWKMFGSNGKKTLNVEQPTNVIESFTKRANYNKNRNFKSVIVKNNIRYIYAKCIVRSKYLIKLNIHTHSTSNNNYITCNNKIDNIHHNKKNFVKINENVVNNSYLHLNHYAIQSFSWFMKIKSTRGDATVNNNVRNEKYFRMYDNFSSDIDDFELFNKWKLNNN